MAIDVHIEVDVAVVDVEDGGRSTLVALALVLLQDGEKVVLAVLRLERLFGLLEVILLNLGVVLLGSGLASQGPAIG